MSGAGPTGISGATRVAAVIGHPVEHSMSPALHNAAFAAAGIDAVFVALPVAPADLAAAIAGARAQNLLGLSVTVPHKEAVLSLCDELDDSARRVGAVNCLSFGDDRALIGHNTDAGGFVDSLGEHGISAAGARAVLLGGGGAARAVFVGLEDAGAEDISVIARTPARVTFALAKPWSSAELSASLSNADLLVDCTSMGLSPDREAAVPAPVPVDALPDGAAVTTLVYHRDTDLLARARARGLRVMNGAGMLVHQGARAFEIWTRRAAPVEAMWRAMMCSEG